MTSTHRYTVTLVAGGELPLDFRGGSVSLDESSATHVSASVDVVMPDEATLAVLDPRETPRIRIDVEADVAGGTQERSFDLTVRDVERDPTSAELSITAASDEALLMDYSPLADDDTPFELAGSLRAIVNYVLDVVIPGAELEATPDVDGDATPYWDATNSVTNPTFFSNVDAWTGTNVTISRSTGAGAEGSTGYMQAVSATQVNAAVSNLEDARSVRPGDQLIARAAVRTPDAGTRQARVRIGWLNEQNKTIGWSDSEVTTLTSSFGTVIFSYGRAPRGASRAFVSITFTGVVGADYHVDAVGLFEGPFPIWYFDGGTADTAEYGYAWGDASNASTSTRSVLVDAPTPDSLVWRAGQSAMDFLAPLVQRFGFRLVCDENRMWTLRDEEYVADGSLTIRYAVNLTQASDRLSRDSNGWFDAAVCRYEWTDAFGVPQERIDSYAQDYPHTKTVLFEKQTPYPGPGFAEYAVRRAQGRGREVTAAKVSDWRVHVEQPVTIILPDIPTQTGKASRVVFDLSGDEVAVTARTTDTPAEAWLLIPSGESWADSPVGESWTEEVI